MTQDEVLNFLKTNKSKWFSSKDIAKGIKVNPQTTITNLKKLRKTDFILFKVYLGNIRNYKYRYNG